MINLFIFAFFFKLILSDEPSCNKLSNLCSKCHPIKNLCISFDSDIYAPDDKGGYDYAKKWTPGNNYCIEWNSEGKLFKKCEDGNFPDGNDGCSYTNNYDISKDGECLICR